MDGIKNKYSGFSTKILIVDDNPIPTIKMVETLLLKFSDKVFWNDIFEDNHRQCVEWNKLKSEAENNKCYENFYGKFFNFTSLDKLISVYIYNPIIGDDENDNVLENNKRIYEILSSIEFTHIWMDSGHSAIKIIPDKKIHLSNGDEEFEINCGPHNAVIESGFRTNSMNQINSKALKPYFAKAEQILVYTYNPSKTAYEINKIKENIWRSLNGNIEISLKEENIIVFETSETVKFYSDKNQINGYEVKIINGDLKNLLFLGTKSAYELYGQLMGNVLFDAHKYHSNDYKSVEDKRYNFFSTNNLIFLEKIKLLNKRLIFSQGHNLALVSYQFVDVDGELQFLLDTPYKDYFTLLNKIIIENDRLKSVYDYSQVIGLENNSFWIKYVYRLDGFNIYYEVSSSNNLSIDFEEHLKIIHTSIFYSPQLFNKKGFINNFIGSLGLSTNYTDCHEVIYFVTKNEIIKNKGKGILHYVLHKKVNTKADITDDKKIIELHENGGKYILTPMVQPTIYPTIKKQIDYQSNLNAISSVVIYNMTHTDGSHTIIDTENFLLSIAEELNSLNQSLDLLIDEKSTILNNENFNDKLNDFRNRRKELFKILKKQTIAYNEHIRLVMEVSDALSKGFTSNTYYSYNLYEILKYWKENYFSYLTSNKIKENFLGRGLNDGLANSIIKFESGTKKNVLFPLGELGTTAFLIVLKNIFRNIKKHSDTDSKKNLQTVFNDINKKGNETKPIYEVEIKIVNNDNETKLKDNYYKIECIEKTNTFDEDEINEKISDLNKEFEEEFNADKMDKNWGLKEMKVFASFLIGFPVYDPKLNRKFSKEYVTHNGINYPKYPIKADKERNEDKYQLKHVIYLKKPKFATIIFEEESDFNHYRSKYDMDEIRIVHKNNKDFQSPSNFVIEYNCSKPSSIRRSHNFRYFNQCDLNFENDLDSFKTSIENKWIKNFTDNKENKWRKLNLYYKSENNEKFIDLQTNCNVGYDKINKNESGIIDNHFRLIKKLHSDNHESIIKTIEELKQFAYYEEESNLCRAEKGYRDGNIPYYLKLESYNLKVGIWDERIQQYLRDTDHNEISQFKLKTLYELKQIFIPTIDLDICYSQRDEGNVSSLSLDGFIYKLKELPFLDCEYLIIHYSGFEKIVDRTNHYKKIHNKSERMKKAYGFLIGEQGLNIKNTNRFIIFTSGKSPATLPAKSLFINFSTLNKYIKSKSKLELIHLLTSVRINRK